ncbi:MAG TPA: hypothetical protein P5084_12390 [Paludibacter sp.]|nr:hypothetical protein [Paludibacter sp.]
MIFSYSKWENAAEIRPYVSVARSTQFSNLEASLLSVFENFIRPLLGETMTAKLIAYYSADDPTDKQKRLIEIAQRANALLAFWYDYSEMQLLIDESGSHRQESDTQKTPYKYQEQQLRDGWKMKGFNALDSLLEYLELNVSDFSEFAASANYTLLKKEIVRSTKEAHECYWINNSRIIFLRLKPHFRIVTDTIIAPRLGDIYTDMITSLTGTTPDAKYTKLREKLIPVVVFYAVSRLLRESGSLTERGLFFEMLKAGDDVHNTQPVGMEQIAPQAAMAEGDAISYWTIAEKYLTKELGYSSTTGTRLPKFNNTDKKYFIV